MKNNLAILLFLTSFIFGQNTADSTRIAISVLELEEISISQNEDKSLTKQEKENPKKYISVGFLDHKTGFSFVGFARTLKQTEKHEIFVGGGTLIAMLTTSLGRKYYFNNAPFHAYSVLAINGISGMGGLGLVPFVSLGIEKHLIKKLYFNLGVNSLIRVYSSRQADFVVFPAININMRY